MLSLCHRSPDFLRTDSLFPRPLKDCVFRPYAVQQNQNALSVTQMSFASSITRPMFSTQVPLSQLIRPPSSIGGAVAAPDNDLFAPTPQQPQQQAVGLVLLGTPRTAASQASHLFPPTQQGRFTVFEPSTYVVAPTQQAASTLLFSYRATPTLQTRIASRRRAPALRRQFHSIEDHAVQAHCARCSAETAT